MTADVDSRPPGSRRARILWPAIVLCLAFGLRAGFVVYRSIADPSSLEIADVPGENDDQVDYDTTARSILAGRGFWSSDAGGSLYLSEPGYPLFLAALYLVLGHNLLLVKLCQAALGAATCYLVFRTGKELAGETAGLAGALLLAVHPSHVYYTAFVLSETLKVFMVTLMVFLVTRAVARSDARSAALAGLSAGAAAATRIVALPYLILVTGLLAIRMRTWASWRRPALFAAAGLLVLLPWTVRNYVHTGVLSPVRPDAAQMIVDGSDPYSMKRLEHDPDYRENRLRHMREDSLREREKAADAGALRGAASAARLWWARLSDSPGEMAALVVGRFLGFFKLYPQGGDYARPAVQAYSLAVNLPMILLGALGAVRSRIPAPARAALVLVVVAFAGVHLLYHTVPMRYRMPIEPALLVLAGAGLVALRPRPATSTCAAGA